MEVVALAIHYHRIGFAQQLSFDSDPCDELHLVHASGRGMRAHIPAGWIAFLVPLSGRLGLESQDVGWSLRRGRALLWREGQLQCVAHAQSLWLSLCGPASAWSRYIGASRDGPI